MEDWHWENESDQDMCGEVGTEVVEVSKAMEVMVVVYGEFWGWLVEIVIKGRRELKKFWDLV